MRSNIDKYVVGLDLGQQTDYSVITAIKLEDEGSYSIVQIKKYALKTSYVAIVGDVENIFANNIYLSKSPLVVDATGVGRPVVDMFRSKMLNIIPVTITSGGGSKIKRGSFRGVEINAAKKDIVSCMQVLFQNKKLNISDKVDYLDDFKKELLNFKYTITNKANKSYGGAYGVHDDIVMSAAIALWFCEASNKKKRIRVVTG